MYLLGSLIVFFCTGVSMTHLLISELDEEFHPDKWDKTFEEVLPYLQTIFLSVIRELHAKIQPEFAGKIAESVKQLCNPDPAQRGHPRNIMFSDSQYSLERYVSIFGNLASKAEYSLKRKTPLSL